MLITLARKPLVGSVVQNALQHGCGALNVDACRIEGGKISSMTGGTRRVGGIMGKSKPLGGWKPTHQGRWPANVLIGSEAVLAGFPHTTTNKGTLRTDADQGRHIALAPVRPKHTKLSDGDSGSAARFFKQIQGD